MDTSLRFAVIGAGRLGASLALALRSRGASLVGYTAHTDGGRARAEEWLGGRAAADLTALTLLKPDVYFLCVPDRAVAEAAAGLGAALAALPLRPGSAAVAHTSGATSVRVLEPCIQAGAATFVFHPLQTFSEPIMGSRGFASTAVAITPAPFDVASPAARHALAIAALLEARPFLLPDDTRALYHAAASVACNYFVTLEHHAEGLFVKAGLPRGDTLSMFFPLVRATLENMAAHGTVNALTGPLSRGDVDTIAGHLVALERDAPALLPLYRTLGLATLDLVSARGEVDPAVLNTLAGLLTPAAGPSRRLQAPPRVSRETRGEEAESGEPGG